MRRPPHVPLLLLLAGCAATPQWQLVDPGSPTPAQRQLLVQAERHYRAGEDFTALRAELVADPVTAFWFTRMVVRDVVTVREGRIDAAETSRANMRQIPEVLATGRRAEPGDSDALLRATARQRDPVEVRALAEIDALGAAGVPCLIRDLARHPQGHVRRIGVELLARVGSPALPGIDRELVGSAVATDRRTGALAIGEMQVEGGLDRLRRLVADADYGVRAAACSGLDGGGPDDAALLRRVVETDSDPFVRRAAATALASHREAASAQVLVAFLQRCKNERDAVGVDAAQEALQRLAGTRGLRSIEAWREWARAFGAN